MTFSPERRFDSPTRDPHAASPVTDARDPIVVLVHRLSSRTAVGYAAPVSSSTARRHLALLIPLLACGCWTAPRALVRVNSNDPGTWIDGFSSCIPEQEGPVQLDPTRPVTVLVHGCMFSRGGFSNLAQVFEARGQQTLCFNYDDRERLETSSTQLIAALEALQGLFTGREITVVGHSQGGLVSRRALVADRERPVTIRPDVHIRLVTVSSPFGGIRSSSHCGLTWLHAVTLGVTVGVCQAIAGAKWQEIYPGSEFMVRPGKLVAAVTTHVKVVTDERDSCRRYGAKGLCAESDYVFAQEEQYGAAVDGDGRVSNIEVRAGHIEIVGERGTPPMKLLDILQAQQILAEAPPGGGADIAALLERLY